MPISSGYCPHTHNKVTFKDGTALSCSLYAHKGRQHEDHTHAHNGGEVIVWVAPRRYVQRFFLVIWQSYWDWSKQLGEAGVIVYWP